MIAVQSEKITAQHQERQACIYIRQSTPRQVRENRESQENQYALVTRAQDLGWIPERVHVIDVDEEEELRLVLSHFEVFAARVRDGLA